MYLQGIMLRHRNKKCIQVRKFTRRLKCQMDVQRMTVSKEVTVTPVRALRLCTGRTAHSGSRGIALPFHDHGTRRVWGVSVTPRPLFNPGKDPVPIVQEAGWAPGPVWTDAENLAPPGFDPWTVHPTHFLTSFFQTSLFLFFCGASAQFGLRRAHCWLF
jgi:hypothetical protein